MHARRHGDGVRSRFGFASGRISPDSSIRGHRSHSMEFRNVNRGFSWGPPKNYPPLPPPLTPPPPPQPPFRSEIFMEAGRLAAEYLVSQGLLPPNSIPGNWYNGYVKGGQMGDAQVQAREKVSLFSEGRSSSHSRVAFDGGRDWRRYSDDFGSVGYKNSMRGRRKVRPSRGYGSGWSRENGRRGQLSERTRVNDMPDGGSDYVGKRYEGEAQVGSSMSNRSSKVITDELQSRSETTPDSDADEGGSKASASSVKMDLPTTEPDSSLSKGADEAHVLNSETKEVNDRTICDKMEVQENEQLQEGLKKEHCSARDEVVGKHGHDLLRLCSFAKVPTKVRSALSSRVPKVVQGRSVEDAVASDIALLNGSKTPMEEDPVEDSIHCLKNLNVDTSEVPAGALDETLDLDASVDAKPLSLSDGSSFTSQQESSDDGPPGFAKGTSMPLSSADEGPSAEERSSSNITPADGTKVPMEEDSSEAPDCNSKIFASDLSKVSSARSLDEAMDLDASFVAEKEECAKFNSFSDGSASSDEQEASDDGPPGFVGCEPSVLLSRVDQGPDTEERSVSTIAPADVSKVFSEKGSVDTSTHSSQCFAFDLSKISSVRPADEAMDVNASIVVERKSCSSSKSFSDRASFASQQEPSDDCPPGFIRCKSFVVQSGMDPSSCAEDRNAFNFAPTNNAKIATEGESDEASTHCLRNLTSDISIVPSFQSLDAVGMNGSFVAERERCSRLQSFSDGYSFMNEQESTDGLPGYSGCKPIFISDGENSASHVSTRDSNKRCRESPSSAVSQAGEDLLLHNLREKRSCLPLESPTHDGKMVDSIDPVVLVAGGLVPTAGAQANTDVSKEKQVLPTSFKICDLNLMDASAIAENPDGLTGVHVSTSPSAPRVDKEMPMSSGVSTSNGLGTFDDYIGLTSGAKDVTVDVSSVGSLREDKVFDASGKKNEAIYSNLENFLSQMETSYTLPDVQDGYNNALSHLYGTDSPHCSTITPDIDDLPAQMSFHGQEGIPCEDDPVYLTLGEIPISFLGVWDQPAHDYGKPF